MLSMLKKQPREVVISEPDVQAALAHLKALPLSKTSGMPDQWGREWVLQCIREAIDEFSPKAVGEKACVQFGPGLWALLVPYGTDLAGAEPDSRMQAWVLIRPVGTDPNALSVVQSR